MMLQMYPHTEACNAFVREKCATNWEVTILSRYNFIRYDTHTEIDMNDMKNCQGYIEENGGRRPGHLVLYPIEVVT